MARTPTASAAVWTASTPTTRPTPTRPTTRPAPWRPSIVSSGSRRTARPAVHSGTDAISTPVRPAGTARWPAAISRNGTTLPTTPSSSAGRGRARSSPSAARTLWPWTRMSAASMSAASAQRAKTICVGANASSAAAMKMYAEPQHRAWRVRIVVCRNVIAFRIARVRDVLKCESGPLRYVPCMTLELRLLRSLVVVAEERHLHRAAARLHLSQPALTRQVQTLEERVGAPLLVRLPRGVDLTEAGRVLAADARRLVVDADRALDRARRAARGELGHNSIG